MTASLPRNDTTHLVRLPTKKSSDGRRGGVGKEQRGPDFPGLASQTPLLQYWAWQFMMLMLMWIK